MSLFSRRQFIQSTACALTGTIVGCGRATPRNGPFSDRELRIFVYAGGHDQTMRDVFVPSFEATTGAAVTLFPGWWDGIAKLKTAPSNEPPFDLMITDATQGYPAARDGMFAQIDFEKIPNHRKLSVESLDNWVFRERYGLPYPDSVMTLAFNKRLVTADPSGWSTLLRPELSGKLGLYSSFYMSLYTFAAVMADATGAPGSAKDLVTTKTDSVFEFAREHRRRIKLWWPTSTDMILVLNDGQIAAGNMHSPEYLQALREQPDLGAVVPDSDRAMVQVFWSIPAGSPNRDLAQAAIDLLFSDEIQRGFAKRGMATSRLDTAASVADDDRLWKSLYPHTSEQFRALQYYPYDFYAEHWDELADRWDRTILRDG